MRVVGYVRVSTKEQEEQGYSIPAQVDLIRKYCQDRNHTLLKIFKDVESGSSETRRDFIRMLEFVRTKNVDGVISWRLDRLTRNFRDYVALDDLKKRLLFEDYPDNRQIVARHSRVSGETLFGIARRKCSVGGCDEKRNRGTGQVGHH